MLRLSKIGAIKLNAGATAPYLALLNGGRLPAGEAHVCSPALTLTSYPISSFGFIEVGGHWLSQNSPWVTDVSTSSWPLR